MRLLDMRWIYYVFTVYGLQVYMTLSLDLKVNFVCLYVYYMCLYVYMSIYQYVYMSICFTSILIRPNRSFNSFAYS